MSKYASIPLVRRGASAATLSQKSAGAQSIDDIIAALDAGGGGLMGYLSPQQAIEVTAVLACCNVIADGIAVPELHVMREGENNARAKAKDDPRYRLLHRRPNDFQTSFEFRQMVTLHSALTGVGYFLPIRDPRADKSAQQFTELLPLLPHWVTLEHSDRYAPMWRVQDDFGLIGRYAIDDIVCIRNTTWSMVENLAPVRLLRAAIGLSKANETAMADLANNGGRPSGILTTTEELSPEAVARIKGHFKRASKSGIALLDNGLTFNPMAMNAVDAQVLETRRFQVEDICRGFQVFPIMVGHSDKTATFASSEAFFSAHNRTTVRRWQRNWSEKLDEWILDGDGPLSVWFDNDDFALAPIKDQGGFLGTALGSGGNVPFMTVNEARELRGLGPIAGGEVLREPAASTVAPVQEGEGDAD